MKQRPTQRARGRGAGMAVEMLEPLENEHETVAEAARLLGGLQAILGDESLLDESQAQQADSLFHQELELAAAFKAIGHGTLPIDRHTLLEHWVLCWADLARCLAVCFEATTRLALTGEKTVALAARLSRRGLASGSPKRIVHRAGSGGGVSGR